MRFGADVDQGSPLCGVQRWRGVVRGWWDALGHPEVAWDDEPIGVHSWRPSPQELVSAPAEPASGGTYAGNPYTFAGRRWPTDGGRQL